MVFEGPWGTSKIELCGSAGASRTAPEQQQVLLAITMQCGAGRTSATLSDELLIRGRGKQRPYGLNFRYFFLLTPDF